MPGTADTKVGVTACVVAGVVAGDAVARAKGAETGEASLDVERDRATPRDVVSGAVELTPRGASATNASLDRADALTEAMQSKQKTARPRWLETERTTATEDENTKIS